MSCCCSGSCNLVANAKMIKKCGQCDSAVDDTCVCVRECSSVLEIY